MGSPITESLLKLYSELDPKAERAAHFHGASCRTGCDACCYMMTTVSVPEALVMAEAVAAKKDWMSTARRLQKAAKKCDPAIGRGEWFRMRVPCPMLNREKKVCEIYGARPSACRYYYVVSPALDCSIDKPGHEVKCVDLTDLEAQVWRFNADVEGRFPSIAPLPLMVLGALMLVFERAGDNTRARHVRRLLKGVLTPDEWLKGAVATMDNKVSEDTDQARQAILAASRKVGLIP